MTNTGTNNKRFRNTVTNSATFAVPRVEKSRIGGRKRSSRGNDPHSFIFRLALMSLCSCSSISRLRIFSPSSSIHDFSALAAPMRSRSEARAASSGVSSTSGSTVTSSTSSSDSSDSTTNSIGAVVLGPRGIAVEADSSSVVISPLFTRLMYFPSFAIISPCFLLFFEIVHTTYGYLLGLSDEVQ